VWVILLVLAMVIEIVMVLVMVDGGYVQPFSSKPFWVAR
jgi:hypothetical protein